MEKKPPFIRSAYNYDMNKAGDESALKCADATLAKQSFADECDINTIVRRFHLTGELPQNVRMPQYGDFTGINDFHTAVNAIALANEAFDKMPADIRARFHNEPGEFVAFCMDDKNRDEAVKMGLVPPAPPKAPEPLPPPPAPPESLRKAPKTPPKGEEE